MELSERMIRQFESEGFDNVYEWQDPAGKVYEKHDHKGKVSIFVTDGSITFDFGIEKNVVGQNERFDIPVEAPHSAVVGPQGCIMIIGEMTAED